MKYATIDTNGLPTAFYDKDIHTTMPAGVIAISDAEWEAHINGNRKCWDGTHWIDCVQHAPTLAEVKSVKRVEVNVAFQRAMDVLVAGYPEREIDSWPQQEREARAYAVDQTALTPLLDAQAAARGWTKQQLVDRIILKANQFAAAAGALIGKRQALEDAINAAQTIADVEAIVW